MHPVTAAILGALIGATIVGLAWRAVAEHRGGVAVAKRLAALEQEHAPVVARLAAVEQELANLERVRRNKLYRESLEDVGFANSQAAVRLALMREEMAIVERILNREHKP